MNSVIEERGKRYGRFEDNAIITQACEDVFRKQAPSYDDSYDVQKEACHMIIQKLSRCFCGDVEYLDNWVDIVGYAQNVVNYLEELNNDVQST